MVGWSISSGPGKGAFDMSSAIWHDLHPMEGAGSCEGVSLVWGAATDVGLVRSVNEDSLLAEPPLFVVADGMGGHAAGDVASAIAVDMLRALAERGTPTTDEVISELDLINREVVARGASFGDPERAMGTTTAGISLVNNGPLLSWMVFNVGDSRIYSSSSGRTELLSVDHSLVQELVDEGKLDEDQARRHPQRNVVTRAMGVAGLLDADVWLRPPLVGERFMVCSDGLNSEVSPSVIDQLLASPDGPADVASSLVAAALTAGGHDNVSVIVIDVVAVDSTEHDGDVITSPRGVPVVAAVPVSATPGGAVEIGTEKPDPVEMISGVPTEWNDPVPASETDAGEGTVVDRETDG